MRYAFLIYCGEDTPAADGDKRCYEEQFTAVLDRLRAHGVLAFSQLLQPSRAARVVRCWDGGDIVITGGPAAQSEEQLTGWVVADCEDLDAAVHLATTIPAAWYGSVEVRPAGETLTSLPPPERNAPPRG